MYRLSRCVLASAVTLLHIEGALIAAEPADLVLRGGRIVTVDDNLPEAQALAVAGDRIVSLGSDRDIDPLIGEETRVIDLQGRLAIPGFIEGHGHFLSLGRTKMNLELQHAQTWDEVVQMVARAVQDAKPGQWIVGRGWHQSKWERPPQPNVEGYPTHAALSRVTPDNPVMLGHASGHMCFANAKAMELAGVGADTADPAGGEILRDDAGAPIGAFRETAQAPIRRAYARAQAARSKPQRVADSQRAVDLASQECLSKGVTSFHDAGSSFADIDLFRRLADEDSLPVRLWVMLREPNDRLRERIADYRVVGYGNNFLTVRGIKRMADGALGAHGAWLISAYTDMPQSTGLAIDSPQLLQETALIAVQHDFQLCVHAIGDRANREVLDVFRTTFATYPSDRPRRWRIEHAQHLHPADIPRFADLDVIASMQGNHCTSDGPYVIERLGKQRAENGAYAWRSLLDAGAMVINGTDVPVEDVDPISSFYASVTRRLKDGSRFFPEQCMTRAEALRSYTLDAAYAAFEEDLKGSLTPGKLADIVVLSKDILSCREEEIPRAQVELTILGGQVVYDGSAQ